MNCDTLQSRLDDYLDGELAQGERDAIEAHLAGCERCERVVANARSLAAALASVPIEGPSSGFAERALMRAQRSERRTPKLVAAGFLVAFAASVFTVIYTGLLVDAPRTQIAAGLPSVAMTIDESRVVNLVFASATPLNDVSLLIDLPPGVDLSGYEGRRRVEWQTDLEAGRNVLPLELVAREAVDGQLIARLEHADQRKVFRVFVSVAPG